MSNSNHPPSDQPRDAWFRAARFGLFIHFGPYAAVGRGEQVLFREHLNIVEYERNACSWNPTDFDADQLATLAVDAGARYAVFTARHHDGYCLWDSSLTNYSSSRQAPRRDFVREYVDACRNRGLRVGLYYSLADWRIPAYWEGPQADPEAFDALRQYVQGQVRELLTQYGPIDILWFDGAWPHSFQTWQSDKLLQMIRETQPGCMVNNRLGKSDSPASFADGGLGAGESGIYGDFGTPEHHTTPDAGGRPWEACHTTTWRLWGYARGERFRSTAELVDLLTDAVSKGGNLLLNVAPDGRGAVPAECIANLRELGGWVRTHAECIYGAERGDIIESVTYGRQIVQGTNLYLVFRFWPGVNEYHIAGLGSPVVSVTLVSTGQSLDFKQENEGVTIRQLPIQSPDSGLFPVIRLTCQSRPVAGPLWACQRLWSGDPSRMSGWARERQTATFDAVTQPRVGLSEHK